MLMFSLSKLLTFFVDERLYATVSEFWSELLFFELVTPDEIAYVYKIKPAVDFGVPLVSYIIYCYDMSKAHQYKNMHWEKKLARLFFDFGVDNPTDSDCE